MKKYTVDKDRVFYFDDYFFSKPLPMPLADAASFEEIGPWFAKDHRHVYFLHNVVEGADPASFTYLGGYNDQWAKDRARAYHFQPTKAARQYRIFESDSLDRFCILPNARFCEYAGDTECIYHRGKKIRGADAPSFEVMITDDLGTSGQPSIHFARDVGRIYFDGQPIKDAVRDTFAVIRQSGIGHQEYGVDVRSAYCQSQKTGKLAALPHSDLPAVVREYVHKTRKPQ